MTLAAEQLGTHRPVQVTAGGAADAPALGDSHVVNLPDRTVRLFFLCGHPKSGTNWVGAVLNLHPAIVSRGEFRFEALRHAFDALERHWWHVAHDEPVKTEAERCFRETVARLMLSAAGRFNPRAEWIGDRTPRPLAAYIPGAPQVYIVRDPRDVLVSWTHQELREGSPLSSAEPHKAKLAGVREAFRADPGLFHKHPEKLLSSEPWVRFLARRMARHINADLDLIDRARRGEIDMPLHVVRYELLHTDFEPERARLYRFFGLDPAQARPASHDTKTLPGFEAEDATSFFRKGEPGDWRRYFTNDAKQWFRDEAAGLLSRLEYETSINW
ncbi:MAG: sulfotransferase domain-containing protein [Phycisphaerales bacterium]